MNNKFKTKLYSSNVVEQSDNISDTQAGVVIEAGNPTPKRMLPYVLFASAMCISMLRYITITPPIIEKIEEIEPETVEISQEEMTEQELAESLDELEKTEEIEEGNDSIETTSNHATGLITFSKGDTLASVLEHAGINRTDIQNVASAVSRIFPLRKIKPGQQIVISTGDNDKTVLKTLEVKISEQYKIVAEREGNHFVAKKVSIPLKRSIKNVSGVISPKSPKSSLQQCGIKNKIANDVLNALGQVTSLHCARSKVNFDLVYEQYCTESGKMIDSNLLAIVASVDGKLKKIYKFSVDGSMQYIDANGTVLGAHRNEKMFIQPILYKKITSRFGYRIHPISGRGKMHTGVDLAASIGTPVRATASGYVAMACHYSGYGRYIKIRHSGTYSTAYAHLSRIVIQQGQYVKQGQVIGYSGASGYATGAHLHYEVMQNGRFINPLSFVPKPAQKLTGKQLVKFNAFKKSIKLKNLANTSTTV